MRLTYIILLGLCLQFTLSAQQKTVNPEKPQNTTEAKEVVKNLKLDEVAPQTEATDSLAKQDLDGKVFTQELEPSLLWKIDHDSLDISSYLYGTMHLPDSRVIELFDSIGNTIESCEAVAVEIILDPSAALAMMPKMMMKDSTLKDFYTPEEYKRVDAAVKRDLGIMGMFSGKMKPVMTSTSLQQARFGGDISYVVDQYIQEEAKRLDKELIGIETVDEQMDALTSMSLQLQADMLLEYIDEIEYNDSLTYVLVDKYLNQQVSGLLDIYSEDEYPDEMNDNLVLIRNIKMAKRVEKMIRKQPTFIAVGALHLPGETGLINMFREAGFRVEAHQKK